MAASGAPPVLSAKHCSPSGLPKRLLPFDSVPAAEFPHLPPQGGVINGMTRFRRYHHLRHEAVLVRASKHMRGATASDER